MTSRTIKHESELDQWVQLLRSRKLPMTVSATDGIKRSVEQNRLQRMWMNEAADQLAEYTSEEYRAYCKLHFGVPILRERNDDFRESYDKTIRPLTYEQKLEVMGIPIDFPVTRLMTVKQKKAYLDAIYQHFDGLGVDLTEPKDGD